jgi:hypothetical protein
MIASYTEQIFYHYILENQIFLNHSKSDFFTNSNVKEIFDVAKEHALRYKTAPTKDQVVELLKLKGMGEKYNDEIISSLYNTRQQMLSCDPKWLEENVAPWIQVRNLDMVMRKAIAYMKTTKMTADNAAETVETVRHMLSSETALDFSFNLGSDFFDPKAHLQTRLARTSSGYDFIDLCLKGGYWKGSLIVFLGGPKCGKSFWLNNLALKSVQLGFNTAYITLELQEEIVNMRLGANMFTVPIDDYEEWAKDQDALKRKISDMRKSSLVNFGTFHVKEFPASTCSANDLRSYLKKTEEILGIKFDNVFVDYLNIMKNWRNPNTENTYMKIKQIAEDVRAMAMEEQWAVISATQTNRGGWDTNDLSISDVSESAALLHTVDMLFGLITNPEMKARMEYYLKCLASRVSGYENTKKRFTIDWKYGRIEEDKNSQIQDMDFVINSTVSKNHTGPRQGHAPQNRGFVHTDPSVGTTPNTPASPRAKQITIENLGEVDFNTIAGF